MATSFKKILCPIDLDVNATEALDRAALVARQSDSELVLVLHVIPVALNPQDAPLYADLYKPREAEAREKMSELARKHLAGLRHDVVAEVGDPAAVIVDFAERLPADLLVMPTHRRRLSRLLFGSVAETVMREVRCPVLTVKSLTTDPHAVAQWMTAAPTVVAPNDTLAAARKLMDEGDFRSLPVVGARQLVGIITDRDLRSSVRDPEKKIVDQVMIQEVISVAPDASIFKTSRLLADRKIGSVPVLDNGKIVGIISTPDLLRDFDEIR